MKKREPELEREKKLKLDEYIYIYVCAIVHAIGRIYLDRICVGVQPLGSRQTHRS